MRLLLIEDNEADAKILQRILAQIEWDGPPEFEWVDRLEAAESTLAQGRFDVVMLDLHLPDVEGLNGFEQLSQQFPDIPIVILTGLEDQKQAIEAIRRGAHDYLIKEELDQQLLSRSLQAALQQQQSQQRLEQATLKLRQTNEKLQSANVQLEAMSRLDPLTNLLNRRGLEQALSRELLWSQREGTLVVLLMDLDNFKQVNDRLGHATGDMVLQETAKKIQKMIRATDYAVRIGGDEFLVLLPQTNFAEGIQVAEKLRRVIAEPMIVLNKQPVEVTVSMGVATVVQESLTIDQLLIRTRMALAKSKQFGKNRVSAHAQEELETTEDPVEQLKRAVVSGKTFRVVKQPIFQLSDQEAVGYEFLSRFQFPDFEMPDDFFRACMEANVLGVVDQICFQGCMAKASEFLGSHHCHLNLFPSTMMDLSVEQLLSGVDNGDQTGNLCVEISEQQIIGDPSYLIKSIAAFRKRGVLIAIDDIGFGRSSLESLILLEPDILKVDISMVSGVFKNKGKRRSLGRLLRVADTLGTEVIAEGIEFEEDLNVLKDLGVEYGQGYYLKRPE